MVLFLKPHVEEPQEPLNDGLFQKTRFVYLKNPKNGSSCSERKGHKKNKVLFKKKKPGRRPGTTLLVVSC